MPLKIVCPNPECGATFSVPDEVIGRMGRCKRCRRSFPMNGWEVVPSSASVHDGGERVNKYSVVPEEPESSGLLTEPGSGPPSAGRAIPDKFGRYRILKPVGKGGMGAVYLAFDTKLDRQVALKVPHLAQDEGQNGRSRFFHEAKAAAALDHPNLCPVYDVGEVEGVPYLTMPYLTGRTLADLTSPGMPTAERQAAAVVRKLALALEEAHRRGVVHRDLKPANVMVSDGRELVVMDFGLARRDQTSAESRLTRAGEVLGTPSYMAPEQVRGETRAIGPRTDVYSLGVILYELLTGRLPFEGPPRLVMGLIVVVQPEPPSTHRPDLSPQLDAICRKAMAREVDDRYASMAEFASALGDWLSLTAQPMTPLDRMDQMPGVSRTQSGPAPVPHDETLLRQFFAELVPDVAEASLAPRPARVRGEAPGRPSRRGLAFLTAGAILLLCGCGFAIYRATDQGTIKIQLSDPSAEVRLRLDGREIEAGGHGEAIKLRSGEHELALASEDFTAERRRFSVRRGDETVLRVKLTPRRYPVPEERPSPREPAEPSRPILAAKVEPGRPAPESRNDTGDSAEDLASSTMPIGRFLDNKPGEARPIVTPLPDGPRPAADSQTTPKTVKTPEVADIPMIRRFTGHQGQVNDVAFLPDGRRAVSGGLDGTVRLWDLSTGEELKAFVGGGEAVWSIALTPDGRQIVSAGGERFDFGRKEWLPGSDFAVYVWDVETGRKVRTMPGHNAKIESLSLSKDGRRLITSSVDGSMCLWDLATGRPMGVFPQQQMGILSVSLAPGGRQVLVGGLDSALRSWDVRTGAIIREFRPRHSDIVLATAISSDGRIALSGGLDKTLRAWDVASGRPLGAIMRHETGVKTVALSSDGHLALAGSGTRSDGGSRLVPTDSDFAVRLWDLKSAREIRRLEGHRSGIMKVAFSPDDTHALSSSSDGTMILWRLPLAESPKGDEKGTKPAAPRGGGS